MSGFISKCQPSARLWYGIVRRSHGLCIYEIEAYPAPAYPVRFLTVLALAQSFVTFQMALTAGQAASADPSGFTSSNSTSFSGNPIVRRHAPCTNSGARGRRCLAIIVWSRTTAIGFASYHIQSRFYIRLRESIAVNGRGHIKPYKSLSLVSD